ncbi:MAG: hypothetical protein PUD72_05760 [Oscillospiraceae bacterium]|nr:hypothetical protein [Oscillospiraceae bacterium]
MKKLVSLWPALIVILVNSFIFFFVLCIPINLHAEDFWIYLIITSFFSILFCRIVRGITNFGNIVITKVSGQGRVRDMSEFKVQFKAYLVPIILLVLMVAINIFGDPIFHAKTYSQILPIVETDFASDIPESMGTDSIALMDTASAKKLGDREIGSLSKVVSQYNVSDDYSQIDFKGKPIKVAALDYAGFFKWFNNRSSGVCGYVTVDPVSMSASYVESKGMKYVPSGYLFDDAYRHIWLKYPTTMFGNLHFEIDESGAPYYVASVYSRTVGLFGGQTVSGCIVMDPVTGEMNKYSVSEIPRWVDNVFDGTLLCEQYNWYGTLHNGFWNSIIGMKDCKRVTSYSSYNDTDDSYVTKSDFGYVAKDGDIWIYTGITSVNGDSSNIGFLLANERTGEAHYFPIAGADEWSAMAAAEGEVQEKGYQASFPSLINVSGNSTYIMVLKDASGLVKLYAAVNVEQYNLVTTATTQAECLAKYKEMLGVEETKEEPSEEVTTVEIVISDIKYIDIDGNTYIYLIADNGNIYKARAASHENMLLLKAGDSVKLEMTGNIITKCEK